MEEVVIKKKCRKCLEEKVLSEYHTKYGKPKSRCKKCCTEEYGERQQRQRSGVPFSNFRKCSVCLQTKTPGFFSKSKYVRLKLNQYCSSCKKLRQRLRYKTQRKKKRKNDERSKSGCVLCDEKDPDMLLNSHIDPLLRVLCICCDRIILKQQRDSNEFSDPYITRNQEHVLKRKLEVGGCDIETCRKEVTEENSCMFDWDHLDPNTKIASVSQLSLQGKPILVVDEEIKKCRLLCASKQVFMLNRFSDHHKKHTLTQIRKGGVIWERKAWGQQLKTLNQDEDWFIDNKDMKILYRNKIYSNGRIR